MNNKTKNNTKDSKKYIWNFSDLYANCESEKFQNHLKQTKENLNSLEKKWRGNIKKISSTKELLNLYNDLEMLSKNTYLEELNYFVWLRVEIDNKNEKYLADKSKYEQELITLANITEFVDQEIPQIGKQVIDKALGSSEFAYYKHHLERTLLLAKYKLSEETEKAIQELSPFAYSRWQQMTDQELSKQTYKGVTMEDALSKISDKRNGVRKKYYKYVKDMLQRVKPYAIHEFNSVLGYAKVIDSLKKYEYPQQKRLLNDDISKEVVDSLIASYKDNLDVFHKYYKIHAKKLGLKKLEYYDKFIEFGDTKGEDSHPFEKSIEHVKNVFTNFHPKAGQLVQELVDKGHIDVYPRIGKSSGAFCTFSNKRFKPYVLLNHTDTLRDMATIAHELGHALHHSLTADTQLSAYQNIPVSIAEIASTFFEELLYTTVKPDMNLKFALAQSYISTIPRQLSFYRFEEEVHNTYRKEGDLSAKKINEIFTKHIYEYLGPAFNKKNIEDMWIYVPHFRYYFYVYSYASGNLISLALLKLYQDGKVSSDDIIKIFSMGSALPVEKLLLTVGIDISKKEFWDNGFMGIKQLIDSLEI